MEYDAIIVGAGAGGLTSALLLAKEGKNVLLLERQLQPGGVGTSFKRKGFSFESAIHCIDGFWQDSELRKFFQEMDILRRIELIEIKNSYRTIYPEHNFVQGAEVDNYKVSLKKEFPQESKNIDNFFKTVEKFYKEFQIFSNSDYPSWIMFLVAIFRCPIIIRYANSTAAELLDQYFKDDKLKGVLSDIWRLMGLPPKQLSAIYFLVVFYDYHYKPVHFVKGGFTNLFKAIVDRIKELGSEVKFNTTVKNIIVENDKVKCVITDKGEEFKAKVVISNANYYNTFNCLIGADKFKSAYLNKWHGLDKSISAFQIYVGLKVPTQQLGIKDFMVCINHTYSKEEDFDWSAKGDYHNCGLGLVNPSLIDSTLIPEGKGNLGALIIEYYKNWQDLSPQEYQSKKDQVANILVDRLDKQFPGFKENIELLEVATPKTIERYASIPGGSIYGFSQTVKQAGINREGPKTKIKGLFLAGAWTIPGGGVYPCFISGIQTAELVLKFLK